MAKLSPLMMDALKAVRREGATLRLSGKRLKSYYDGQCIASMPSSKQTIEALATRGLIENVHNPRHFFDYRITEAGRAALAD